MKLTYPKVYTDQNKKVFISFYFNNVRIRLYSAKKIGGNLQPNMYCETKKIELANVLCSEVYNYLKNGGKLLSNYSSRNLQIINNDMVFLEKSLEKKANGNYSKKYIDFLTYLYHKLLEEMKDEKLSSKHVENILSRYSSPTSFNTVRRHLNALINGAIPLGLDANPLKFIKSKKNKAKLHRPFEDVSLVLKDIFSFNFNLYLCSILTYGCLLRPHREIRELKWGDFTEDLKFIKLSGNRNKSGRNRIVPVPIYIREYLYRGNKDHNIFTQNKKSPNPDYFKTIWSRYKKTTSILDQDQTLYSFRHSGAIDIFKRTGSITKLQKAMGHSSINVSLIYLRGLEISELKEEDMPMV